MPKKLLKTQEFETEEVEVTPDNEILNNTIMFPSGRHVWRQQGPYVVCRECELNHAVYIGTEKLMVGEDSEGKPMLKSRQDVFGTQ